MCFFSQIKPLNKSEYMHFVHNFLLDSMVSFVLSQLSPFAVKNLRASTPYFGFFWTFPTGDLVFWGLNFLNLCAFCPKYDENHLTSHNQWKKMKKVGIEDKKFALVIEIMIEEENRKWKSEIGISMNEYWRGNLEINHQNWRFKNPMRTKDQETTLNHHWRRKSGLHFGFFRQNSLRNFDCPHTFSYFWRQKVGNESSFCVRQPKLISNSVCSKIFD